MSVSNRSRRQGTILDEIMGYRRERLPVLMRDVPLEDLRAFASVAPHTTGFRDALKSDGVSVIAECKKASPSKGLIAPDYNLEELAATYASGGALAISVLTDARFFQGSLDDLRTVKETVRSLAARAEDRGSSEAGIPVLRKDFLFHPYQIYEARAAGADAVLLIAAVLKGKELENLLDLARELAMEALVETHDEEELDRALQNGAKTIGINNRNLQTFEIDFETSARLRKLIPDEIVTVAESGIRSTEDIRRMSGLGFDAVLVGESLMKSKDRLAKLRAFVEAGKNK
jgi:indole-3-glycerol phosphate synthase